MINRRAAMTYNRFIKSIFIILFTISVLPSVSGNIRYYDPKGKTIGKPQYEEIVKNRDPKIDQLNKEGYGDKTMKIEDPVLLRKKRMEQWEKRRKSQL
jgi:hypothetical protein